MSSDPAAEPYRLKLSSGAARALAEKIPLAEVLAIRGLLTGDLLLHPFRVGKPLEEPLRGYYSARVHPYRILYRVDRDRREVHVHRIALRADAYRAG